MFINVAIAVAALFFLVVMFFVFGSIGAYGERKRIKAEMQSFYLPGSEWYSVPKSYMERL